MNVKERIALLQLIDVLEPPSDGISTTFTLAPIATDTEEYRLGWEAACSVVREHVMPLIGPDARAMIARRRERASRVTLQRRADRIASGLCLVRSCDQPAVEIDRCSKHAAEHRERAAANQRDRRDRILADLEIRRRLEKRIRKASGEE